MAGRAIVLRWHTLLPGPCPDPNQTQITLPQEQSRRVRTDTCVVSRVARLSVAPVGVSMAARPARAGCTVVRNAWLAGSVVCLPKEQHVL